MVIISSCCPSTSPTFLSIPGGSFWGSAGSPELLRALLQRAAGGDLQMGTVSAPGYVAVMLTLAATALSFSFMKTGMIVSVVRKVPTHRLPSPRPLWMEGYQATVSVYPPGCSPASFYRTHTPCLSPLLCCRFRFSEVSSFILD